MNKSKYILLSLVVISLGAACKKEQLMTYNAPDNIYFFYKKITQRLDSVNCSFAYSPATVKDSTIMVPFTVTGVAASTDREFVVTADPASTAKAGTHYILPAKFVLAAGRVIDSFPVKLIRTPDLQTGAVQLKLNMSANSNFHTDIKGIVGIVDSINALAFKINISDILTQGNNWAGIYSTYFGTFSVKKWRLLNQVTGIPLDYTVTGIYDLNLNARCAYFAINMSRYLKDQAAAGKTVYEDDGTPMVMNPTYQ